MPRSPWWKMSLLVVSVVAAVVVSTRGVDTQEAACYVAVSEGAVQGSHSGAACAFLGIPFGASTAAGSR
jgi:hypothetical protein